MASSNSFWGLLATVAGLAYGLFYLTIVLGYSLTHKDFWQPQTSTERRLHERASQELWSLRESLEGIKHEFLRLVDGTQLHYLLSTPQLVNPRTLIIFLHGFPDSAHLFLHQLRSHWARDAQLVALDLPGCGGSDSIEQYGPDQVLNVLSEAIVLLKERHLDLQAHPRSEKMRCILVGHDWGGIIGFRLAAETSDLLDHLIVINSLHPAFAEEQLKGRIAKAKILLKNREFRTAASVLGPVLSQLVKSSYTYMFSLPLPLAKLIPRFTMYLIRASHNLEYKHGPSPSQEECAIRLAISCGPGTRECLSPAENGSTYGPSVYARSRTTVPGDWDGRVKLYAQGLLRRKWTPSYPGYIKQHDQTLPSTFDGKHFKCPVSFIFGLQDIALDPRIAVDGVERYFLQNEEATAAFQQSRVVRLPRCGHWSLLEKDGERALNEVLGSVV